MRGTLHDPVGGQSRETVAAKQDAPIQAFERRRQQELEERRQERRAEGGRTGDFNDRQVVERRPSMDDGYDEFGRLVAGRAIASEVIVSKADRATAQHTVQDGILSGDDGEDIRSNRDS